jgi:hypothetical protein
MALFSSTNSQHVSFFSLDQFSLIILCVVFFFCTALPSEAQEQDIHLNLRKVTNSACDTNISLAREAAFIQAKIPFGIFASILPPGGHNLTLSSHFPMRE